MIRPFSNRAIRYKSMVSVLISVGFMMSPGLSHAESVLRVATTMADVPLTTGQPSQGGEGQRFIGYTLYDGLGDLGLPLGIQLVGPRMSDARLLEIAKLCEPVLDPEPEKLKLVTQDEAVTFS